MSGPRTYGGGAGGGLYGADAPYGARFQPQAEQGLRVQNAYNARDVMHRRFVKAKKDGVRRRKYSVDGSDPTDTTDIHKYDLTFEEVGTSQLRTKRRYQSTTTSETTLRVTGTLNELGKAGEPKHVTHQRIRYTGIAGTQAERNLLGEDDRHMLPLFNGGICQQINRWKRVINPRDFLVFDVPDEGDEVRDIRRAIGHISGENSHRITPYLKPYNPRDQVTNAKFLTDNIIGLGGGANNSTYETAKAKRDPKRPRLYSEYSATQFGDYLGVVSYVVAKAQDVARRVGDDDKAVYAQLKLELAAGDANFAGTPFGTTGGFTKKSHAAISAAMRFFAADPDDFVGTPFTKGKVEVTKEADIAQKMRYFQDKDNALQGLLASIKDGTAMTTKNIVQISLNGAAPGRPYNGLILQ
jgi:hypothetical protein